MSKPSVCEAIHNQSARETNFQLTLEEVCTSGGTLITEYYSTGSYAWTIHLNFFVKISMYSRKYKNMVKFWKSPIFSRRFFYEKVSDYYSDFCFFSENSFLALKQSTLLCVVNPHCSFHKTFFREREKL